MDGSIGSPRQRTLAHDAAGPSTPTEKRSAFRHPVSPPLARLRRSRGIDARGEGGMRCAFPPYACFGSIVGERKKGAAGGHH
jgi:hypothetical protein